MATGDPLNVVALVSGGKDSFYSILHCLANGHRVIALANLHPPPGVVSTSTHTTARSEDEDGPRAEVDCAISKIAAIQISPSDDLVAQHQHGSLPGPRVDDDNQDEDEIDLNSFMYQTVGHQVIPLYAQATGLPLFRQAILGTAVDSGISYKDPDDHHQEEDETESLVPLLRAVLKAHPEVNALCTGAILSTYQRTRVESVALRLGLIPLAYLWQFPELPLSSTTTTTSASPTAAPLQPVGTDGAQLLRDMAAAGLVARVVKVASAGLGEEFLWENVASDTGISRIRRALRRFGGDGGRGAVLGEGGEFETLVVDGPPALFKGRVIVRDDDKRVVREGGGSAWLSIREAQVEMKPDADIVSKAEKHVRIPSLLDPTFENVLDSLLDKPLGYDPNCISQHKISYPTVFDLQPPNSSSQDWYFVECSGNIEAQTAQIVDGIRQQLYEHSLPATAITNSIIVLRRMADFPIVNKIYGALFKEPNPPARVTISCGDLLLPQGADITILLTVQSRMKQEDRRGLHVQSRSYWAPANIGPYSQAITYPLLAMDKNRGDDNNAYSDPPLAVSIAGQIPLVPASMALPAVPSDGDDTLQLQVTLALQHLWRVGAEMQVQWWSSAVAYFPRSSTTSHAKHRASLAASAWRAAHAAPSSASSDTEEGPDLWDQKYNPSYMTYGGSDAATARPGLPEWEVLKDFDPDAYTGMGVSQRPLPFVFSAEVEELPRSAGVEWHAHLGFANVGFGDIRLYSAHGSDRDKYRTLHHVLVESPSGDMFVQTTVAYQDSEEAHRSIGEAIDDAALTTQRVVPQILGTANRGESHGVVVNPKLTYVNSESFDLLGEAESLLGKGAVIPCRSLWDCQARKLDMVVILETSWKRILPAKLSFDRGYTY
ncbi:adenine nucleotide alpha hydrolases-like protein [Annulohypoxylon bovei var. microspora]|nr:adenine nucleotide alpha hydrolases-like protein [Annulohypoxylon bovei var. microspora]